MRTLIPVIAALAFAAPVAWADAPPAEPAKSETTTASPPSSPDNAAAGIRPAPQMSVAKPRESGPEQPLCTGE